MSGVREGERDLERMCGCEMGKGEGKVRVMGGWKEMGASCIVKVEGRGGMGCDGLEGIGRGRK